MRALSTAVVVLLLLAGAVAATPERVADASAPTPVSADAAFVTAAYHDFLGRAPTSGELRFDTARTLASVAARTTVVRALATSPEWISVTVDQLYQRTLGRPGDPGGLAYWIDRVRRGESVASVAAAFYASSEYFAGAGGSDLRTWVGDLYTEVLGRDGAADPDGVAYWVTTAARVGRTKVAYAFYQSSESRHDRVAGLYRTLLGRGPDRAGWDYWSDQIAARGDLALATSLAASDEYDARGFGRYGTPPVAGTWTTLRSPVTSEPLDVIGLGIGRGVAIADDGTVAGTSGTTGQGVTCGGACSSATPLPLPAGVNSVDLTAMSANGHVVGQAGAPSAPHPDPGGTFRTVGTSLGKADPYRAVLWATPTSPPTELAAPAGYATDDWPTAVSDSGIVVGTARGSAGSEAVAWPTPTSAAVPLATWNGREAQPTVVSDSGVIAGSTLDDGTSQTQTAVVWASASAAPTALPAPAGTVVSSLVGFLANGDLVGTAFQAHTALALVWSHDLSSTPTPLAKPAGYASIEANGVSSTGAIVGFGVDGNGHAQALVWPDATSPPTVLAPLPGDLGAQGLSINSDGVAVGFSDSATGGERAVRWADAASSPTPLQPAVPSPPVLVGISGTGALVGNAGGAGVEWHDRSTNPSPLPVPSHATQVHVDAVAGDGTTLGGATDSQGTGLGLAWSDPSTPPTGLAAPPEGGVGKVLGKTAAGGFVGLTGGGFVTSVPASLWWASATAGPAPLPTSPRGYFAQVAGVTPSGEVVGNGGGGLVWSSPTATPVTLRDPPGSSGAQVVGVSDGGLILGTDRNGSDIARAFVWTGPTSAPRLLAVAPGLSDVAAAAIAPDGTIVGTAKDAHGAWVGLVWSLPAEPATVIEPPAGAQGLALVGIAPDGSLLGEVETSDGHLAAVVSGP